MLGRFVECRATLNEAAALMRLEGDLRVDDVPPHTNYMEDWLPVDVDAEDE